MSLDERYAITISPREHKINPKLEAHTAPGGVSEKVERAALKSVLAFAGTDRTTCCHNARTVVAATQHVGVGHFVFCAMAVRPIFTAVGPLLQPPPPPDISICMGRSACISIRPMLDRVTHKGYQRPSRSIVDPTSHQTATSSAQTL